MRPDDSSLNPQLPVRPISEPDSSLRTTPVSQAATANIVRNQIDQIFDGTQPTTVPEDNLSQDQQQLTIENPYERTHAVAPHPQAEHWKRYHSAWQDYYQKYYERYYTYHINETKKQLVDRAEQATQPIAFGSANNTQPAPTPIEELSRDEAVHELRSRLIKQVKKSSKKARASRHFVPITSAAVVVLIFLFLQYNRVIIANVSAYVSPGNIDPQNIIIDPTSTVAVSAEARLIIPKINIDVPTIYGIGNDHDSQMSAMQNGVAHFAIPGANSVPGQVGNTVLSGHSSNDLLDQGDYKFIFAQLDKLEPGDMIYVNYLGVRYSYTITKEEVVTPKEVSKLIYKTDKPVLTLITCTPLGTSLNRLLVTAEQVSPDPSKAAAADTSTVSDSAADMPGSSPTFIERLFGQR